jgi:hypothetical protein
MWCHADQRRAVQILPRSAESEPHAEPQPASSKPLCVDNCPDQALPYAGMSALLEYNKTAESPTS